MFGWKPSFPRNLILGSITSGLPLKTKGIQVRQTYLLRNRFSFPRNLILGSLTSWPKGPTPQLRRQVTPENVNPYRTIAKDIMSRRHFIVSGAHARQQAERHLINKPSVSEKPYSNLL